MVYDAIIVGAGPAGGMAARALSKRGYNILILDKKEEVGYPIQCAGGLGSFALENNDLKEHPSWIKTRMKGIKTISPNGKHYFLSKESGYTIDRRRFDQWIVNSAVDDGATLLLNTRVNNVTRKKDYWVVATKKKEFETRIVIGADGPSSNIARHVGLLKSREFLKGLQYKFSAKDVAYQDDGYLCIHNSAVYSGGYAWVFPMGDEYNIGVDGYTDLKILLGNFCKSLKIDIDKKKEINAGILPYHYVLENFSKDGIMIVGDAAGMTNPMHGGGVHAALFSGRTAGDTACKALEQEDFSILSEYDLKVKNSPFLDPILFKASKIFRKWDDEIYNFLGDMMEGIEQSKLTYFQGFKKMMKKPKYFLLLKQFLTMKKAMLVNQKYGW